MDSRYFLKPGAASYASAGKTLDLLSAEYAATTINQASKASTACPFFIKETS